VRDWEIIWIWIRNTKPPGQMGTANMLLTGMPPRDPIAGFGCSCDQRAETYF